MKFKAGQEVMILNANLSGEPCDLSATYIEETKVGNVHLVRTSELRYEVEENNLMDAQEYWDIKNLGNQEPCYVGGMTIAEATKKRLGK